MAFYGVLPTQKLPVDIMAANEHALIEKNTSINGSNGAEVKACNTKFTLPVGNLWIFEEQNHFDRP